MGREFVIALRATALIVIWVLLFLVHTRVVAPAILQAHFRLNLAVGVVVGLLGLGFLAWLGWIFVRRIAADFRKPY